MKKATNITSLDIAKTLGVENEYNELLIEHELEITRNNFMNEELVSDKNNFIDNINKNEFK